MAIWGGGQVGGWSQNLGGQSGMRSGAHDGWDEDYLGKVYDAEVVRRLIPYIREWKAYVFVSLSCMVLTSVSQFIQPLFIGLVVKAAIRGDTNELMWYAFAMIGFAVVQNLSAMVQQLTTAWMGTRILRKLQSEMYDHVQNLSLSFYDEMEIGRIISRLTSDVQVVQDLLTTGSLTSLSDVIGISIVVVVLLLADWQLALVTFTVVPPLVLIMVFWSKLARDAFMQTRITISALYGNLAESISGVRATQSMSREQENSRRFDRLNDKNRVSNNWAAFLSSAVMPVIEVSWLVTSAAHCRWHARHERRQPGRG
jgi:ABC-type multidrug transport system fused ATPase/permease subunit